MPRCRKAVSEKLQAHVAAGTFVPKPPVGKLKLVHSVKGSVREYMVADLKRGQRRAPKIHNIAVAAKPAKPAR